MTRVDFTDRDLGIRFPEILTAAGLTVERHRDHFLPDCPDEEWLQTVGQRGWVVLTHDRRIRYKPNELDAVMRHDVALLVIIGQARFAALADAFVATLPRVEGFLARHTPPFIAKVYRSSAAEAVHHSPRPVASSFGIRSSFPAVMRSRQLKTPRRPRGRRCRDPSRR